MSGNAKVQVEKSEFNEFVADFLVEKADEEYARLAVANRAYYSVFQAAVARYLRFMWTADALAKEVGWHDVKGKWQHSMVWRSDSLEKVFKARKNLQTVRKISNDLMQLRTQADYYDTTPKKESIVKQHGRLSECLKILGDDTA